MKIFISILFFLSTTIALATNWYVNDNSTTGDIYCSAVGNDANAGTASAPFGSFKHALTVISAGDFIDMDVGVYSGVTTEFGLSVTTDNITVVGAGMNNTFFLSNNNIRSLHFALLSFFLCGAVYCNLLPFLSII